MSDGSSRAPTLRLEIRVPCDGFTVELAWETEEATLGLFGPSGAGKTTILEALAGLRPAARGRIEVNGHLWLDSERRIHLPPEARGVGYVPQDLLLFPHLDVLANLRFGARRQRALRAVDSAADPLPVERILEVLELEMLSRRSVGALSGGERQRVALGRALCSAPKLLLLDEPLAHLDLPLRRRLLPYLLRVQEEFCIPTVFVSHDPSEMTLLAREIVVLKAGSVAAHGRPMDVFGQHAASAEAVVTVLSGTVVSVGDSLARVEIQSNLFVEVARGTGLELHQRVALELLGTEILLATGDVQRLSAQNVLPAVVQGLHYIAAGFDASSKGALVVVQVGLTGGDGVRPCMSVVVTRRAVDELALTPGAVVQVVFKAQACRLLSSLASNGVNLRSSAGGVFSPSSR